MTDNAAMRGRLDQLQKSKDNLLGALKETQKWLHAIVGDQD